ncbi:MAG TPA: DUF308 domain-containing protein [Novosphingobium sp.]|nr:DUF308 domain-containing protein [Novosphingobium sp.]
MPQSRCTGELAIEGTADGPVSTGICHFIDARRRPVRLGWVLAYGALLVVAAVIVLLNPLVAGLATGLMLGIVLVFYGVAAIVSGFTSLSGRARWLEILLGVLALAAGVYSLFNPVAGALSLVWAIGAWLFIAGIFQVIAAFKARHDRGWRLFLGVVDVVLGLLLLFSSPATGLVFVVFAVAFSLMLRGVFLILLAIGLRTNSG